MALIDSQKFYKELDASATGLPSVYFIFGDEPFLIEQSVERFKFAVLNENSIDFNYNLFYADDSSIENVIDVVETLPVFTLQRLVILKNSQHLTDAEWALLEPLISQPVTSTVFVIMADKIDKRKKHFKSLIDKSHAIEFKKPYDNEIPRWIQYYAQQFQLKLNSAALQRFHRLVGNNLSEIYAQMIKLKTYMNQQVDVDENHINSVISYSKEESVFDFTKAIGSKDKVMALEQIVHLLDQGQNEMGIVVLLARHIRILLTVRHGLDMGVGGTKLANMANVSPYFIDEYVDQAKKWTTRKLQDALLILQETDRALKTSPTSSHIWLENLVIKSCSL